MTKAEIRKQMAQTKTFHCLETLSPLVLKNLQALDVFQQAKAIGLYMPLPDEVDLSPLFQTLDARVYVPAFDGTIDSYRMANVSKDWKKGKFGIPEPAEPVWAGQDELDLIVVPGVAFDHHGNRLGRGGGFYDRLLPQYSATRIGICFDFQCLETFPTEAHDCKMNRLVTESENFKFE
jgi:5-formyltetrahydrofolate cyclo-ligase